MSERQIKQTNRFEWPDYLKGILMFGVVWGHLITTFLDGSPNHISIHWIIRTFDMPFFMLFPDIFSRSASGNTASLQI